MIARRQVVVIGLTVEFVGQRQHQTASLGLIEVIGAAKLELMGPEALADNIGGVELIGAGRHIETVVGGQIETRPAPGQVERLQQQVAAVPPLNPNAAPSGSWVTQTKVGETPACSLLRGRLAMPASFW